MHKLFTPPQSAAIDATVADQQTKLGQQRFKGQSLGQVSSGGKSSYGGGFALASSARESTDDRRDTSSMQPPTIVSSSVAIIKG